MVDANVAMDTKGVDYEGIVKKVRIKGREGGLNALCLERSIMDGLAHNPGS